MRKYPNESSELMKLLKEKGKTPAELAEALHVKERTVYNWFAGSREPKFTIQQVKDLCVFLEVELGELPSSFERNQ